jgi:poly(3-hydroxybutyrate) depolymerase
MDLFNHLRRGDQESAAKIKEFYDEYFAVCDLPAQFYLDTVQQVFHEQRLAKGTMTYKGRPVDPSQITKTALFTVEGALDDIAAPGQTTAAHHLLSGLSRSKHYHYLQDGAGHYGIFNGRRWRDEIAPRLNAFIRKEGLDNGLEYDAPSSITENEKAIKNPAKWAGDTTSNHLNDNDKSAGHTPANKSGARRARLG